MTEINDSRDYTNDYDPLTQLPNRSKLITVFNESLQQAETAMLQVKKKGRNNYAIIKETDIQEITRARYVRVAIDDFGTGCSSLRGS